MFQSPAFFVAHAFLTVCGRNGKQNFSDANAADINDRIGRRSRTDGRKQGCGHKQQEYEKSFHEPLAENQKMLYFIPAVPLKASLKTELPTVTRFSRRGCPALSFFGALPLPSLYIGCHPFFFFIFLCSPYRLFGVFFIFLLFPAAVVPCFFHLSFLFSVSHALSLTFFLIFRAGCCCLRFSMH